jgi:predicted nucleic acid-binding protein
VILYLDTSALVKRYVREQGSDHFLALIDQAELVGSSFGRARIDLGLGTRNARA